jgi:hypothetical protein
LTAEAYETVARWMDGEWLLHAFQERGWLEAVEEAFNKIILRGIVPDARVYGVLSALCDGDDRAATRRMLGMHGAGWVPVDGRTFDVVAIGCVAVGIVDTAREVAREAVRLGLRWDAPALSKLVASLRAGDHASRRRVRCCIAPVDASAFGWLIGKEASCNGGAGLGAEATLDRMGF